MGKPGWVRSSAWIWLFSSPLSTTACSGGCSYRPPTSSSLSWKCGSWLSLKARTRWGCNPWAVQTRCTNVGFVRRCRAKVRVDQWVAPGGVVWVVVVRLRAMSTWRAWGDARRVAHPGRGRAGAGSRRGAATGPRFADSCPGRGQCAGCHGPRPPTRQSGREARGVPASAGREPTVPVAGVRALSAEGTGRCAWSDPPLDEEYTRTV